MKIIAGNSNRPFAQAVAHQLGVNVCDSQLRTFSDREISVRITENIRGEDAYIIQSTCCPANDNLMELLICIDALKRASAKRITAVIPYFGYARQDRKGNTRTAISAKLVADIITTAGADRILTMDLHAGQIGGFFNIPVDQLMAMPLMADDIKQNFRDQNVQIVSPDVGGVVRARALSEKLGLGLAIIDKRREKANESEVMNIIGDVEGFDCILVDDIVDTAGTLCHASAAIMKAGAKSVTAYTTHGVLSGPAFDRIRDSELKVMVSDTIPFPGESDPRYPVIAELIADGSIRQFSVAKHFAEAIRRANHEESVSRLNN